MPGWALIVLTIAAAAMPSAITVFRCPGSDGETLFSDRPCHGGHVQAMQPTTVIDMPHLSADEQTTLDRLDRGPVTRSNATELRAKAGSASPDARRCEAARDGLDQVHAIKRRGYRASSAASLDARQRRYETQRDHNCTRP